MDNETADPPNTGPKAFDVILNILIMGLFLAAIGLGAVGIEQLYNDSYDRQVVGGDAYNYIIYGTRGTAYVGTGIISAVLANTLASFKK